ncbi:MAG: MoaD/ThiS family protein [Desulfofustis sp.]|nr:MoaD/ThiS family protein [Desulfofustis sp.]
MKLTVKLFAYFRDNRFVAEEKHYPQQTTVADILADLGIDEQEVGVTMLNSRHCRLDTCPQEDDILAIFPVIGGG